MKLTALMVATTTRMVSAVDWFGVRISAPPPGSGSQAELGAAPDQDRARGHLAGQLADRVQAPPVVDKADRHDQPAGQQQPGRPSAAADEHVPAQRLDLAGHHQPGRQPAVDGQAAQQRDGHHVHVPVPGGVHRAHRDRHAAHQRREQVGDSRGDQESKGVLSRNAVTRSGGEWTGITATLEHQAQHRAQVLRLRSRVGRGDDSREPGRTIAALPAKTVQASDSTSSAVDTAATSRSCPSDTAPARSSRGMFPVRSTIVDGTSLRHGPPSRYTETVSPSCSSAAAAVVAAGRRCGWRC